MSIAATTNAQNIIDATYGTGAGSFELPGFTNADGYITLPAGSTAITGWTVDPTALDWVLSDYWNPSDGRFSLDLNGLFVAGGIHTTIPTIPGKSYVVSFDLAGFVAGGSPTNPKSVAVSIGTITNTYSLTVPTVSGQKPFAVTWSQYSFEFIASATSYTLSFRSLVPTDASGLLLDNVSIRSVTQGTPVPASIYRAVEIVWTATSGKTYQVQSTLSLDTPIWADFGEPIVGDGTEKSIFDKTRDASKRFYRVIEVP